MMASPFVRGPKFSTVDRSSIRRQTGLTEWMHQWHRHFRRGLFCLMMMVLWAWLPGGSRAFARVAPGVNMQVDVGYQSYYDPNVWAPVRVAVNWNGTAPKEAYLRYRVGGANRYPYDGALQWPIHLERGRTVRMTIGVPGHSLAKGGLLQLVVNGQTVAQARPLGAPVQSAEIAGVISDNPGSVQFLAGVASSAGTSQLVAAYMQPRQVPAAATLLQGLTYLYVDGRVANQLSSAQARAIINWVRGGGILLLGGIEPNAGQTGNFASVMPVSPQIVRVERAAQLAQYVKAAPPHGELSLLFGQADAGTRVLVGSTKSALLATRGLGRGEIAYLGFDAAAPSLVAWSGNALFWDRLLRDLSVAVLGVRQNLFGPEGAWTLMAAAEQFPQLHSPPLYLWEIVFGVYTLLVGPVLYFVLRRRRKNEWAWLVLPAMSLAFAGVIYIVGILQQPHGILTQSVGFIDIADAHLAELLGVQAMMSPQTRTLAVRLPVGTWVAPLAERVSTSVVEDGLARFNPSGPLVTFGAVRAWGGRFAYAVRSDTNFGQVGGQLFRTQDIVGGYLTNHTRVRFAEVALVADNQVVGLGPLAPGQSVNVQFNQRSGKRFGSLAAGLGNALPSALHGVGRALFAYADSLASVPLPPGTVLLLGWTHTEPPLFHNVGSVFPAAPQWIVREVLRVTPVVE